MRILFFGDVVGRTGREALMTALPDLRREFAADFVIVNGENSAGGFGMTPDIYEGFVAAGADCVTTGDHVWDQKTLTPRLAQEKRMLRCANFPETTPGQGLGEYRLADGRIVLVLHLMGQVFMKYQLDNPFAAADRALKPYKMGRTAHAVIVDFHAEATSEKCAMGHHLDGRASLVVGSHTHIPTADAQVLPNGTAYLTDAGMCGDYNSVIGMQPDVPLQNFIHKRRTDRMTPADGEPTLCGVFVETDDATGLATHIQPVRRGGRLEAA